MAMKKIMAANGSYTDREGNTKTNWVKIGMLGMSQNGKEYILLDPCINLAGFTREMGKDMLMCSVFEDQPKQQGYSTSNGTNNPSQIQQQQYNQNQNPPPAQHLPQQNQNTMPNQQGASYPVVDDLTGQNIPFDRLR